MNATIQLEKKAVEVVLGEGALKALFALPSMKEPPSVDWAEVDGIEIDDISATQLDEQKVSIPMYCRGGNIFPSILESKTIRLTAGGVQFGELRPTGVESVQRWGNGWSAILLCLRNEKPMQADSSSWESGISILQDAENANIWMPVEVKSVASIEDATGRYYFHGERPYKAKYTIDVPVLMRANTLPELWEMRGKLLSRLSAQGLRTIPRLHREAIQASGVYASASSRDLVVTSGYKWTTDITFTITKL